MKKLLGKQVLAIIIMFASTFQVSYNMNESDSDCSSREYREYSENNMTLSQPNVDRVYVSKYISQAVEFFIPANSQVRSDTIYVTNRREIRDGVFLYVREHVLCSMPNTTTCHQILVVFRHTAFDILKNKETTVKVKARACPNGTLTLYTFTAVKISSNGTDGNPRENITQSGEGDTSLSSGSAEGKDSNTLCVCEQPTQQSINKGASFKPLATHFVLLVAIIVTQIPL